ncbi:hypothetical protein D9M69_584800 [compost metagenome]
MSSATSGPEPKLKVLMCARRELGRKAIGRICSTRLSSALGDPALRRQRWISKVRKPIGSTPVILPDGAASTISRW